MKDNGVIYWNKKKVFIHDTSLSIYYKWWIRLVIPFRRNKEIPEDILKNMLREVVSERLEKLNNKFINLRFAEDSIWWDVIKKGMAVYSSSFETNDQEIIDFLIDLKWKNLSQ